MTHASQEYIDARTVLLDALEALREHQGSLVLVGAQAIYLQTGAVDGTGIQMTSDSDIVLDADFLADDPELTGALTAAGFTPVGGNLPGQWRGTKGVRVDLMVVPHQSNRPPSRRRDAAIEPHGKETARITPGLEAALLDNSIMTITSMVDGDDRAIPLKVAGPAALFTAKLIKLSERYAEALAKKKPARLKEKDALDCYRILAVIETEDLVAGFESHRAGAEALTATRIGLTFFSEQRQLGENGLLRTLLAQALPADLTALASFDALSDDLLEALSPDLLQE